MVDRLPVPSSRARLGWWLFVLALGLALAFVAYSFVGMLTLGVFGYYATRPIARRLGRVIGSDGVAAWATLLLVLVPVGLLLVYVGYRLFQLARRLLGGGESPLLADVFGALAPGQRRSLRSVLSDPGQLLSNPEQGLQTALDVGVQVAGAVSGGLLLVALAVTLSYFLLKNDGRLAAGFRELVGGRDTVANAYAVAVDEDLESVFFGNLVFVLVMTVVAAVAYGATNLLAPPGLQVPMVLALAALTGAASLIPIVVGKVVYLPVVGYLALQAAGGGGGQLAFVGGVLVAYFLVLDILPQTFVQPYLTGQKLDVVLMMFAYVVGPVLVGWYGFFLLPILLVLTVEAVRIVLPQLLRGEPLTATVSMAESVGADPDGLGATAHGAGDEPSVDGEAADEGDPDVTAQDGE